MNPIKSKIKIINKYNNPLYYWWKVRKIFKRPKCHLILKKNFWFFGLPIRRDYYNSVIDIRFSGLGWKWKYDEVRHEWDPYIQICLFRKYHIIWIFNWVNKHDKLNSDIISMATWEAILDYLYNHKTVQECVNFNTWKSGEKILTIKENIKKKYLKTLK